jgi:MoaA/NifB/PqqE/SkfB family radical SAM enzyme
MLRLQDIHRVHLELTTKCNASCPMCPRNYRGYEFNSGYPVTELSVHDIKIIFTDKLLQQLKPPPVPDDGFPHRPIGFYGVNINGNLGDFGLARDAQPIVKFFVDLGIAVNITTNGSMRKPNWWAGLALPGVTIGFALDGLEDTHSIYRRDTDWHRVMANAQAFIAAGGRAVWRFIPFDHNQHQEEQCRRMAQDLGFHEFENISDGRDRGPVYSRQGKFLYQIGPDPAPQPGGPNLNALLENHVTWFDAKTSKIEKDTAVLDIVCEHQRQREIYIAADGSVYPCCFLGYYPGRMNHPGNQQLLPLVAENNALEYDIEHCMQWFDRVQETWQRSSIADGRLYQCVNSCNRIPI